MYVKLQTINRHQPSYLETENGKLNAGTVVMDPVEQSVAIRKKPPGPPASSSSDADTTLPEEGFASQASANKTAPFARNRQAVKEHQPLSPPSWSESTPVASINQLPIIDDEVTETAHRQPDAVSHTKNESSSHNEPALEKFDGPLPLNAPLTTKENAVASDEVAAEYLAMQGEDDDIDAVFGDFEDTDESIDLELTEESLTDGEGPLEDPTDESDPLDELPDADASDLGPLLEDDTEADPEFDSDGVDDSTSPDLSDLDAGTDDDIQAADDLSQDLSSPDESESTENDNLDAENEADSQRDGDDVRRPSIVDEFRTRRSLRTWQSSMGRDCPADMNIYKAAWDAFQSRPISSISLDITPEYEPGEADLNVRRREQQQSLSRAPVRDWIDIDGQPVVRGKMEDFRDGVVIIRATNGRLRKVRFNKLSNADLCFVSSWWGIPTEFTPEVGPFEVRNWTAMTFTWKASGLCHKPLYFEDVQLERYGHSAGPIKQTALSGLHFFGNIFFLPYHMGMNPPTECQYALGYYRPGSCAPWLLPAVPLSARGARMQIGAISGGITLIP